jgi:CRISPR/Cas system CSM-associated protein Csm2 small subunit
MPKPTQLDRFDYVNDLHRAMTAKLGGAKKREKKSASVFDEMLDKITDHALYLAEARAKVLELKGRAEK